MKKLLVLTALIASVCMADEPITQTALADNNTQCREWAVMDGIEQEYMNDYMEQCLSNLSYQEPEVEAYDYVELSTDDDVEPQAE